MRKPVLFICWLIFWITLESTVFSSFPSMNVRIDMALIAVIAIGFTSEFKEGLPYVLISGLFCDSVSYGPLGAVTLSYLAAFSLIRFAASTIYVGSPVSRFSWTFIVSAFSIWIKALLLSMILRKASPLYFTLWHFLQQSLFNGLLGVFVIPLFNRYLELTWDKVFRQKGLKIGY